MTKCLRSVCIVSHVVEGDFLRGIIAVSARRALEKEKINSFEKLSGYSEKEIMELKGFGKNTMQKLKIYMKKNDIYFKSN